MLVWVGQNVKDLLLKYGNVLMVLVGVIQWVLMVLENEGGNLLFGELVLELLDMMWLDVLGKGMVNILLVEKLMNLLWFYVIFLLWLMLELFE